MGADAVCAVEIAPKALRKKIAVNGRSDLLVLRSRDDVTAYFMGYWCLGALRSDRLPQKLSEAMVVDLKIQKRFCTWKVAALIRASVS